MMEDSEEVHVARFGIEVETFLNGELGQFILGMAENQRLAAIEELKKVDTTDSSAVLKLQNELKIPDLIVGWLQEAVHAGHDAMVRLRQEELEEY